MILQALKEYYDRKAADPDSGIAPEGWEWREIPFLVILDRTGQIQDIQDTREGEGKNKRAKRFLVPALGEKKGNGIKSNLLWENAEYMFGIPVPTKIKPNPDPERVAAQHVAFVERHKRLNGEGLAFNVLRQFIASDQKEIVTRLPIWSEVMAVNSTLILALQGAGPFTDDLAIQEAINVGKDEDGPVGFCLIAGATGLLARLEPPIKGVWGAQTAGANIVAVNNKNESGTNAGATPAFASYGKQQAFNSPMAKSAAFAYTTALNSLLSRDSRQRLQVGDASTVFWASKTCDLEAQLPDIFGEPPKDDPDRPAEAVKALYLSIQTGAYANDPGEARFYVLGLAPNAARIAVRFWIADTAQAIGKRILQHFDDTEIAHGPRESDRLSLFRLLVATAVQGKADNIPPNLGGDTMRAILEGLPYPQTLLQAALRRVRAEREITYPRAALIKACVNRLTRRDNINKEEELAVSLDENNSNIGYRLGRVFATLEKIQQDANPGINATIRDRFYGAASSTPVTVFGNLMRLANHWISKLEKEKPGLAVVRKQLLGEIMRGVPDFPAHLPLADQGRFAIGYYHQTQKFYEKKSDKTNE